jgi:hypothetical protein
MFKIHIFCWSRFATCLYFAGAGLQPAYILLEQVCNLLRNVYFAGAGLQPAP